MWFSVTYRACLGQTVRASEDLPRAAAEIHRLTVSFPAIAVVNGVGADIAVQRSLHQGKVFNIRNAASQVRIRYRLLAIFVPASERERVVCTVCDRNIDLLVEAGATYHMVTCSELSWKTEVSTQRAVFG